MHPLVPNRRDGTMSPQQLAVNLRLSEADRRQREGRIGRSGQAAVGGSSPGSESGSVGEWDKFANPLRDDQDP